MRTKVYMRTDVHIHINQIVPSLFLILVIIVAFWISYFKVTFTSVYTKPARRSSQHELTKYFPEE